MDGVSMVFQNTPSTEAPSEMNTHFPDHKALWMAENGVASLHNIYTMRGTPVRDALRWSKYISLALHLFGQHAEVMFASHHWPRWGTARIREVLGAQRDPYAKMNNQGLHVANQGVTINQIHNVSGCPIRCSSSGTPADSTARRRTTLAVSSSASWASGTATRRP